MTNNNIKNNKTKTVTTIIGALVIGFILMSPQIVIPNINAELQNTISTSNTSCVKKVQQQMYSNEKMLDRVKAISLATSDSVFQSTIHGFSSKFNSIFNTWTFDSNCVVSWKTVNVVYTINNTNGIVKNVVVTEDPALSKVISVTEQTPQWNTSANWSGYEFYMSGQSGNDALYEASNSYTEPTVSKPTTANTGNCATYTPCELSIWAGLEDTPGATDKNLAQDGATGVVTCVSTTCSASYNMWYEFLPSGEVQCTGSGAYITSGDSITADVLNEAEYGGSSNLYDMSVTDSSQSTACSTTGYSYAALTNPTYSNFIAERPCYSGCGGSSPSFYTLPDFTTFTEAGYIYDGTASSYDSINVPYGNSWDYLTTMNNGYGNNISTSSVSNTGSFTETWQTSSGT